MFKPQYGVNLQTFFHYCITIMAGKKYYVVWKGAVPGIYGSWEECAGQIHGFTGALYKAFPSRESAEAALKEKPHLHIGTKKTKRESAPVKRSCGIIRESICVDGAWNTATGDMEYRGVYTRTGEELFRKGPYADGTNNIGEFLAIVHALALLKKKKNKMPVYSDSRTALTWVRNKRTKTKLEQTAKNVLLFELLARAEKWLKENPFENPLLKWETAVWGENPADFGRK
jgi:ribonuclease HI